MNRNAISKLIEWKENGTEWPISITGMRGIGKTYLAIDFGNKFYEGILYVSFENQLSKVQHFDELFGICDEDDESVRAKMASLFEIPEEYLGNFLIVLDEYRRNENAKKLAEIMNKISCHLAVVFISSGAEVSHKVEFKCQFQLFPVQFDEFLCAIGSEWYSDVIKGHYQQEHKIPEPVHERLLELFYDFLEVGGLPMSVNEYMQFKSADNLQDFHSYIRSRIIADIEDRYDESETLKMKQILSSIPEQLLKDNQKFQFRVIRKGVTYAMYENAIHSLEAEGLIHTCYKDGKVGKNFKLYPSDISLLSNKNCSYEENFKLLIECYVMRTLTNQGMKPFFWESNSTAKLDFLVRDRSGIVPIDLKIDERIRSKSMNIYLSEHKEVNTGLRISARNFENIKGIKNIPYYALYLLNLK